MEVTDEMRHLVHKLDTMSGEYVDNVDYVIKRLIELHEANKPKPEPVGYAKTVGGYPDESEHKVEWVVKYKELKDGQPLYTTPPTREPLSEDEIEKLVPWQGNIKDQFFSRIEFAREIERAHGIGVTNEST